MDALAPTRAAAPSREPAPAAIAYLLDGDSEGIVRRCFTDLGYVDGRVGRGSIDTATEELARPAPRPAYSVLRSERPQAPRLPHWRAGLREYLATLGT